MKEPLTVKNENFCLSGGGLQLPYIQVLDVPLLQCLFRVENKFYGVSVGKITNGHEFSHASFESNSVGYRIRSNFIYVVKILCFSHNFRAYLLDGP